MHALAHQTDVPSPDADVDRARLGFLRVASARSRCAARSDLFEACAALSSDPTRAADALALALFRGLSGQGGLPKLRIYQPSARDVSFDELWLLAALDAASRRDTDSLTFLLTRRIPRHGQRNVGFLIQSLARALNTGRLRHVA
ncbi:hypothetical protein [Gymnodinialimonas ulvae]|uniref:hypothetical protein n=1 Tax=Gymnodinialimonas ulvae TaxID=3126504 RepID=UPI00309ADA11